MFLERCLFVPLCDVHVLVDGVILAPSDANTESEAKVSAQDKQLQYVGLMYIMCDSTIPITVPGGPCSDINYQETTMTRTLQK